MTKQAMATLAAAVLAAALAAPAGAERLDRIIAVVDDQLILESELEQELAQVRQHFTQRGQRLPPEDELRDHVFEQLITQRAQLARAERVGIRIDDATLDAALQQIAAQNNLTLSQLRRALAQEGIDFAQFREGLREEIAVQRLRQAEVERTVDVSPQEIDEAVETAAAGDDREYRVRNILIATPEAASSEQIRRAERRAETLLERIEEGDDFAALATTYSDSPTAEDGGDLGWRLASQLPGPLREVVPELEPGETTGVIQGSEGFLIALLEDERREPEEMVTQTRARHILIQPEGAVTDEDARQRLGRLRERILAGEDFEFLARTESDDPGSAADGGDLGWTSPGQLVRDFQRVMDNLEPGEVSAPFQTQFGWHIVQVLERRDKDVTDEVRRDRIAAQIRERKTQEALEAWIRQVRDEAYVDVRIER